MIATIIIDNTYYYPQLTRSFFLSTEAWSGAWLGPHSEFFSELGSLNESVTSSPFILELSSAVSPTRHWILPNQHGGKSTGLGDRVWSWFSHTLVLCPDAKHLPPGDLGFLSSQVGL